MERMFEMPKINFLLVETSNNMPSVYSAAKIVKVGILRIAAEIKQAGHNVIVFSEMVSGPLENHWELVKWADVMGFSTISAFAPDTYDLVRKIRQDYHREQKLIIGGGVHFTFAPDEALGKGFDIIFKGPASITFRQYLKDMNNLGINGISYRIGDQHFHNPDAPKKEDLNDLPTPAYETLHKPGEKWPIGFSGSIEWTRSCPHNCKFCVVYKMLGPVVSASPKTVVRDLIAMEKAFGSKSFLVVDDNFTSSREKSMSVIEAINKAVRDGKIKSSDGMIQTTVKMPLDEKYLKALKKSLPNVAVGLEDFRSDSYKKRGGLEEVEEFFLTLNEWGIHVHSMYIVRPDTTWSEIKNAVKELRRLGAKSAQFTSLTPLLGSELWNDLVAKGELDPNNQDWHQYDSFHAAPCYPKDMEDKMDYAWTAFNSPRLAFEKVAGMLKAGVSFNRAIYRLAQSGVIWYPGMRWAWQNRGTGGVLRALKWSLMG